MLAYRHNIPERPRPLKVPPDDDEPYHPEDAIDWRARTLPLTTTRLLVESPVIQQPEMAAVSQENQPIAAKKKAATPTARRPGVIAEIIECISRAKGASIEEIVAVLVKKFSDRDPDGMKATSRIQANKNCTSKENDDKRGLVYVKRR